MVDRFLSKYGELYGKKLRALTDRALRDVLAHPWPGNVRELENAIERAVLLAPHGSAVESVHLFPQAVSGASHSVDAQGRVTAPSAEGALNDLCEQALAQSIDLDSIETRMMQLAMHRARGNLAHAARLLGITRPQLAYRLKKQGFPSP